MPRVSALYLESRREQILEAALRCFGREGFHRTTMQHILRESALSAGALYRYFPSKEDIVEAIAARHHAGERALLQGAAKSKDAREGMRRLAHDLLGGLASPREQEWRRVTVQLWGEALRNRRVMKVARRGLEGPLAELTRLIRRSQRERQLAGAAKPEALARVAAAIFQGLVLQQAWDPGLDVAACIRATEVLLDAMSRPGARRPGRRVPAPGR